HYLIFYKKPETTRMDHPRRSCAISSKSCFRAILEGFPSW
ncbi:conserved hypothetical protein, partial [delta proteobacterium NaphS2]